MIRLFFLMMALLSIDVSAQTEQQLLDYYKKVPQEKVYVHTDRDRYAAGDTVWFRAYVVDAATNKAASRSRFVYLELHDNASDALVSRIKVKADSDSVFANMLPLGRRLRAGSYTLYAYTLWMTNFDESLFFSKQIEVVRNNEHENENEDENENDGLSVAALPEGGSLIVGHRQKLAYKVVGSDGYGRDVSARIVCKETENVVAEGASQHLGMGYVHFTPQKGMHYRLEAYSRNGQSCYTEVPDAVERGVSLSVMQRKDILSVTPIVEGVDASGLSLLIYGSGNVMHKENIDNGNGDGNENGNGDENADNAGSILIDTSSFRPGVVNIAIVSEAAKAVLAERLAFIYPDDTVAVTIE